MKSFNFFIVGVNKKMNKLATVIITVLVLIVLIRMLVSLSCDDNKDVMVNAKILYVNINPKTYSAETQKTLEETFVNLLLLKELLDNANAETKKTVEPSIMSSLSKQIAKIQPVLDYEKEIVVNLQGQTLKLKNDGMGNVCFGSPVYFMCFNPNNNTMYPYVNDMLVVFHLMTKRAVRQTMFPNVEELLVVMVSNIFKCPGESLIDFKTENIDDVLLAKIFNSNLDVDIQSSLMMIVFFMSKNQLLNGVQNMSNNGIFVVNNYLKEYLQQFYPRQLTNYVSYKQMKHALFNICSFKYTISGYNNLITDEKKRQKKKEFVDANLAISLCKV